MDFEYTEEQRLLRESLDRLLGDSYGFDKRKTYLTEPDGFSAAMWGQYAELGLLGSTLWMALLVTTTMGLNRIIGAQKKKQPTRSLGLLTLFETGAITCPGAFALVPASSSGSTALKYHYASEALPAVMFEGTREFEIRKEPVESPRVPQQWIVAMRLALVAFVATAWFLSRSYTTTMYLLLGLATATIALQEGDRKTPDRGHWIFSTLTAEVLIIVLIYGLVRLRH